MISQKLLEIRDSATFIPVLATLVCRRKDGDPESHWLLSAAGYGPRPLILIARLNGGQAEYDAFKWGGGRTMMEAHRYIEANWSDLHDGDIVDVQFILGEKDAPGKSEKENYLRAAETLGAIFGDDV